MSSAARLLRRTTGALALVLVATALWLPSRAAALDELDALTDETIKSACHGYIFHEWSETLAGWFGTDSPLCRRVRAGEEPRAAVDTVRRAGTSRPVSRPVDQNYERRVDMLAIECQHDVLCVRERRRAHALGHPLDMATFERVKAYCEGGYGCIEQRLADWPKLSLPARTAAAHPGFVAFNRAYVTVDAVPLLTGPGVNAAPVSQLPANTPVAAVARDHAGAWLRVRVGNAGTEGYLPTRAVVAATAQTGTPNPDPLLAALQGRPAGLGAASAGGSANSSGAGSALNLDQLVRSGQVQQQHQLNDAQRQAQARERERERLRQEQLEQERLAQERAAKQREQERLARVRQQRQQQQAQRQDRSGMALLGGLAAAGLGVARGMDGTAAGQMGTAIARDIQSGTTSNTQRLTATQRSASASGATQGRSGTAGGAPAGYMTATHTVSCPSGAGGDVPLKYRTEVCKNAMIDFARAHMCNDFNQFSRLSQQCQQACGHPQCLQ